MSTNHLQAIIKEIIREAAKVGLDAGGMMVCGPAWAYVKPVLSPVFVELERRYPKLFLKDGPADEAKAAEAAVDHDAVLQGLLDKSLVELSQLKEGQSAILKLLARYDNTLQTIGNSIDAGFREAEQKNEDNLQTVLGALQGLKLEVSRIEKHDEGTSSASSMTIAEICREGDSLQYDAVRWLQVDDTGTASQRLARGRELVLAGLQREPNNSNLLTSIGFIEKRQAHVSEKLGKNADAVGQLAQAANYFARALKADPSNISALNGIANVYLLAHDYDRAIRLGMTIFERQPDYGAAVWDLTLAIEGKLSEVGLNPPLVKALLSIYRYLESEMPKQPQVFTAEFLANVQQRIRDLAPLVPESDAG